MLHNVIEILLNIYFPLFDKYIFRIHKYPFLRNYISVLQNTPNPSGSDYVKTNIWNIVNYFLFLPLAIQIFSEFLPLPECGKWRPLCGNMSLEEY